MNQEQDKKNLSENISQFFTKFKKPLLLVVGVFIVALVAISIISALSASMEKSALVQYDKIDSAYTAALKTQQTEEVLNNEQISAIITDIDALVQRYPKTVSALQALLLKADYFIQKKDYEKALDAYLQIIKVNSMHYIADIARQNAAAMYEELGNIDKAIEVLEILDSNTKKDIFLSHNHVLFSLGRLYEQKQDFQKAVQFYMQLIATGTNDDWTKLSQSRIIALKAEKKVP